VLGSKDAVLGSKDAVLGSKDAVLGSKDAVLGSKDAVLGFEDGLRRRSPGFEDAQVAFAETISIARNNGALWRGLDPSVFCGSRALCSDHRLCSTL